MMQNPLSNKNPRGMLLGKILLSLGIVIIIGCLGFIVGYATPRTVSPQALPASLISLTNSFQQQDALDIDVFEQVWNRLQNEHVQGKPESQKLYYGMLKGLVASLGDPYSIFFDPKETETFTSDLEGTFEGIGAEIGVKENNITIIAPLAGSPAEKAGLHPNDHVLQIDDQLTVNMDLDRAVSLIRGEKGSTVKLLISRESEDPKEFSIVRDTIKTASVTQEFRDNIAIITLTAFSKDSAKEFDDAITAVALKNSKGLIVDLRNNPGGLLDASVDIAGEFLPKGSVIVVEQDSAGKQKELSTSRNGRLETIPMVLLINNGSASASEIVAGALKDYARATLIGETTFGKGTVQTFEQLSDGSSLKLTTAKWLTPKGTSFNEKGITPDVVVEMTKDDYTSNKDPQLEKAISHLSQ